MRKKCFPALLSCLLTGFLTTLSAPIFSAFPVNPGVSGTLDIGFGWRVDSLNWSFADPTGTPNTLTQIDWKDLNMATIEGVGHLKCWDRIYVKLEADWGWILEGKNITTQYGANDRTAILSQFRAQANNGSAADISGGLGVNLCPWRSDLELVPLVGFSLSQQILHIHNGMQLIAIPPTPVGPFNDLKVKYKSHWYGPWVGLDAAANLGCDFRIELEGEYHWAAFKGNGVWRVHDFPAALTRYRTTFHTHAHAEGQVYKGGLFYKMDCNNWGLGAICTYQRWRTHGDGDYHTVPGLRNNYNTLPADGQQGTIPIIRGANMNPVTWTSYGITIVFHGEW